MNRTDIKIVSTGLWTYESLRLPTDDGWSLAVHRLQPLRPVSSVPVVCIPGHGTTAWTIFGGERGGLAGALAASGRDVWLLDPRGCGDSIHTENPGDVRVRDKLWVDLPHFLDLVERETGCSQVDAVGHSLGGVLIYLKALVGHRPRFRRAVTLGSPLRIERAVLPPLLRTRATGVLAGRLGRIPLSKLTGRLGDRMPKSWMPIHFDPRHMCGSRFQRFLQSGIADVYGAELSELVQWIRTGCPFEMVSRPRPRDGRRLPMPTRFLVGAADKLTTPDAVAHAWRTVGSSDCELHVLGTSAGSRRDYRHTDILLGDHVHEEVSPLVVDWLQRELNERVSPIELEVVG